MNCGPVEGPKPDCEREVGAVFLGGGGIRNMPSLSLQLLKPTELRAFQAHLDRSRAHILDHSFFSRKLSLYRRLEQDMIYRW